MPSRKQLPGSPGRYAGLLSNMHAIGSHTRRPQVTIISTSSELLVRSLASRIPGLARLLAEHIEYFGALLPHLFIADLVRWAEERTSTDPAASRAVAASLDRAYEWGDSDVIELIVVSFVENLTGDSPIVPFLGPLLRREFENLRQSNVSHTCPICGYAGLSEPPRIPGGGSYEICPSCWFEFGVSDEDQGYSYSAWRQEWIEAGMPWRSGEIEPPPDGWDPVEQLHQVTDL